MAVSFEERAAEVEDRLSQVIDGEHEIANLMIAIAQLLEIVRQQQDEISALREAQTHNH